MKESPICCTQCGSKETKVVVQIYCQHCQKLLFFYPEDITTDETQILDTRMVDHYHILAEIAHGSVGKVLLAVDTQSHRKVALKFLPLDLASPEHRTKIMESFASESQVLMAIKHPGIVKALNSGNYKGSPYLVLEYLEGPTLEKLIEQKVRLSPYLSLLIAWSIADALEYGYTSPHKIIHRDVKPNNIIIPIQPQGARPKLIDFGVAKVLAAFYPTLTATGEIKGIPFYIAPEQIQDTKGVDFRADIYSLGATIYHMLAGIPPYHQASSQAIGVLKAILRKEFTPLEKVVEDVPGEVETLVTKAMASQPQDRYASFAELKEALQKAIMVERGKGRAEQQSPAPQQEFSFDRLWPEIVGNLL
jgi:serine/threonine protein kinase